MRRHRGELCRARAKPRKGNAARERPAISAAQVEVDSFAEDAELFEVSARSPLTRHKDLLARAFAYPVDTPSAAMLIAN